MAETLDYSPQHAPDPLKIALATITPGLLLLGPITFILGSNMHNGLRAIGGLEFRDFLGTAIVCATPLAGIASALWLLWPMRRGPWREWVCVALALSIHAWALYGWARLEIGFSTR